MQTRHESHIEVLNSEIKRLEKALREITNVYPELPNEKSDPSLRMINAYIKIMSIAKQALPTKIKP